MTKHRQRSTKVRAEGIDAIWSQLCSSLLETDALLSYQTRASGRPLTSGWMGNPVLFPKETPRRHSTRLPSSCPLILHTQGLPCRVFTRKAWRTDRSWSLKPWRKLGERFFIKISPPGIMNLILLCLNGCFPHAMTAFSPLSSPHSPGQLLSEAAYWSFCEHNLEYQ